MYEGEQPDWNNSVFEVRLACAQCGSTQRHELHYAGRLLVSSRCVACGEMLRRSDSELWIAYLKDLAQRAQTKPRRMITRIAHEPMRFLSELPFAVLAKPIRLAREIRTLLPLGRS